MKRTPIFPKEDNLDFNGVEYDARKVFSQFLEEARKHAKEAKSRPQNQPWEEPANSSKLEEKKSKKSWKSTIFFWMKSNKKSSNSTKDGSSNNSSSSNQRRSIVSGPLFGTGFPLVPKRRTRQATSGPLVVGGLPGDEKESERPYMYLKELERPDKDQAFGPIYLVR